VEGGSAAKAIAAIPCRHTKMTFGQACFILERMSSVQAACDRVNLFFKQFTAITRRYGSFWSFVLRRETENEITRLINKLRWRHKSKTHYL
jgi:hypothetical protein